MAKKNNPELIERITRVASEVASQVVLEHLEKEQEKLKKNRRDRRLRNTKLLLKNYRSFIDHCSDVETDIEELNELIVDEIDADELAIESIKQSKERTLKIVKFINQMLEIYKLRCEQSGKQEDLRKYTTIHLMYIDSKKWTAEQISDMTKVDVRTVYRDRGDAIQTLSALFFGVDGIRFIDN